jgi:hypothetical protein
MIILGKQVQIFFSIEKDNMPSKWNLLKLPKRENIIRDHIKQQPTQSSVTASYI